MSKIETFLSAKALRAVATRYGNLAKAARNPKAKAEFNALAKDAQARADKAARAKVSKKASGSALTVIALRARCTLLANRAKATRSAKAKREINAALRDTMARLNKAA